MRIIIYKKQQYMTFDFPSNTLDKILDSCYSIGISRNNIMLSFSEDEKEDYERLSKRYN